MKAFLLHSLGWPFLLIGLGGGVGGGFISEATNQPQWVSAILFGAAAGLILLGGALNGWLFRERLIVYPSKPEVLAVGDIHTRLDLLAGIETDWAIGTTKLSQLYEQALQASYALEAALVLAQEGDDPSKLPEYRDYVAKESEFRLEALRRVQEQYPGVF